MASNSNNHNHGEQKNITKYRTFRAEAHIRLYRNLNLDRIQKEKGTSNLGDSSSSIKSK